MRENEEEEEVVGEKNVRGPFAYFYFAKWEYVRMRVRAHSFAHFFHRRLNFQLTNELVYWKRSEF